MRILLVIELQRPCSLPHPLSHKIKAACRLFYQVRFTIRWIMAISKPHRDVRSYLIVKRL